jgi:hypothetical protein
MATGSKFLRISIQPGVDAKLRGARDFPGSANAWVETDTVERSPYAIATIPACRASILSLKCCQTICQSNKLLAKLASMTGFLAPAGIFDRPALS